MKYLWIVSLIFITFSVRCSAQDRAAKDFVNRIFQDLKDNNYEGVKKTLAQPEDIEWLVNNIRKKLSEKEQKQFDQFRSSESIRKAFNSQQKYNRPYFNNMYKRIDWSKVAYNKKDILLESSDKRGKKIPKVYLGHINFSIDEYAYKLTIGPLFKSQKEWKLFTTKFKLKSPRKKKTTQNQNRFSNQKSTVDIPSGGTQETDTLWETDDPYISERAPVLAIPQPKKSRKKNFETADQQAAFTGGQQALQQYISKNLHYPPLAIEQGIRGVVYLEFIVKKDGELSEINIKRGLGFGCDKEAVRIVKKMPKWIPAKKNGQAIDSHYLLPIQFIVNR